MLTTKSSRILENWSPIPNNVPNLNINESESFRYYSAINLEDAYSERGFTNDSSFNIPSWAP